MRRGTNSSVRLGLVFSRQRDATVVRVVLTKPPRPSVLEQKLSALGCRTTDLESTERAFHGMVRAAQRRVVIMTPFLDSRGAAWLQEMLAHAPGGRTHPDSSQPGRLRAEGLPGRLRCHLVVAQGAQRACLQLFDATHGPWGGSDSRKGGALRPQHRLPGFVERNRGLPASKTRWRWASCLKDVPPLASLRSWTQSLLQPQDGYYVLLSSSLTWR